LLGQCLRGFLHNEHRGLVGVVVADREDALNVTVTTNFVDRTGTILTTESEDINVIPAGKTFYLGGDTYLNSGERVAHLEVDASTGDHAHTNYPLPLVSRVRLVHEEYLGFSVHGQVTNNLDAPLSQLARISAVVFDSRGRVVGGGYDFLDADLQPGRRAAFAADISASPSTPAYARASVDNSVAGD
jgi:hypothetical protein